MSKSDGFENSLLRLLFNAVNIANVADNAATAPATSWYFSLHTADPGEAGTQASNETTYGGYVRQGVARTTAGFLVTGNQAYLQNNLAFPTPTSGSGTLTHFGVGLATSGAGTLYYKGTLSPNVTISTGITPTLTTGTNILED